MQTLWTDALQKEVANDRLRTAGYTTRVARRRRERLERARRATGNVLVSLGERVSGPGCTPAATARMSR